MSEQADGELEYYRRHVDELAGENLRLDMAISGLKHQLDQKRHGFAILSELQQSVGAHSEVSSIFELTIKAVRGMDRTAVLTPTATEHVYRPTHLVGFRQEVHERLRSSTFQFPDEFATGTGLLVVTKSTPPSQLVERIRCEFDLPYFICVPVAGDSGPIGLLLSGRVRESRPLYPPLDQGDVDTFRAIAGFISASVRNLRIAVLEEMDRVKTEFFANISHEFRTPLMLTLGPLEQIMRGRAGDVTPKMAELTEVMHRNQLRLLELINQILDLTRLEAGQMQLKAALMPDVDRFIAERAGRFEPLGEKQGIEIRLHLAAEDASSLFLDRERFDRMLTNLLSNALKFTPSGHVEVSTAIERDSFILSITDTGIGIKQDQLPWVFDRFRQGKGGESREYEGSGIGLSLVKEIAKLHGGTVSVQSEAGKGSRFTVAIPLGRDHLSPAAVVEVTAADARGLTGSTPLVAVPESTPGPEIVQEANARASSGLDQEKATILYVEDNADLRGYVADLLVPHYNVVLAVDGRDGLHKARQHRPDLVLLDEMMPHMSGRELLAELHQDKELASTPVIFLTARAGTESRIESLEAGADDYLAKPFHEGELLARARSLLRSRAQERELERLSRRLGAKVEEQMGELVRTGELRRFLPRALADAVLAGQIGPPEHFERRKVTVLFADMVGFSAMSDRIEPEEASSVVNDFLREMTAVAVAHGATIDKFIGDAVMVLYGAPTPGEPAADAWAALQSGLAMRSRVDELRVAWRQRGLPGDFGVRIGINTGYCTLGVFGSDLLQSYTAIGPPVKIAARLQVAAPPDGILCGFTTHALVEERVRSRQVSLSLPDIVDPVEAYEIQDFLGRVAVPGHGALTPREREVARLAVEGHTAREISEMLFIAERTVETHLGRVYSKLGVRSKIDLARRAAELEL